MYSAFGVPVSEKRATGLKFKCDYCGEWNLMKFMRYFWGWGTLECLSNWRCMDNKEHNRKFKRPDSRGKSRVGWKRGW